MIDKTILQEQFIESGLMTRPFLGPFRDNDIVFRQLMTGKAEIVGD